MHPVLFPESQPRSHSPTLNMLNVFRATQGPPFPELGGEGILANECFIGLYQPGVAVLGTLPQGGGSQRMGCRGVRVAEMEPKA